MGASKTVLDRSFPCELRLLNGVLQRRRLSRFVLVLGLLLHLLSAVHSLNGRYWLYSSASHLRNDIVIFVNVVSDLLMVAVNALGLTQLIISPFLPRLFGFCTAPKPILTNGSLSRFSRWIDLLRFGPLPPLVIGIGLFWRQAGWAAYQFFLARQLWYYLMNLLICTFICVVLQLRCEFARANAFLSTGLQGPPAHLQLLSAHFVRLCDLLDKFNRTFKALMVTVVMSLTWNILHNCTSLIEYAAKPKSFDIKVATFLTQPLLALTTVGQAAVVAFVGEGLEEEGERTTRICYTLINQLNNSAKVEPLIARELHFILEHSRARKVCLHAGGFFRVNWGILGAITSTVATYSIVIIQFLLK